MSARHPWLRFVAGGPPLPHRLGDPVDALDWQRGLGALHGRWYGDAAPPAVPAVFVLQWLLQVPAHTAALAAVTGPWRPSDLAALTVARSSALVPDAVRIGPLTADGRDPAARLRSAEQDYRALATDLATAYPATVRIGPHVRSCLVDDMWADALRVARAALGAGAGAAPERASCCLIYALPGCHECAGCPRLRR